MTCQVCQKRSYSEYCVNHKPRKPIAVNVQPKRTAIKKVKTQLAMQWEATRQTWLTTNTSPYTCHYCGKLLGKKSVTLDHKIPRSRAPELRYDLSNIVPACFTCNGLKGSVDHDHYKHKCPDDTTPVTTAAIERPEDTLEAVENANKEGEN